MRPQLRRRFYSAVSVQEEPSGYGVLLDGRPVKTPARKALAAPTEALAQALAAEWEAQREMVDPAAMPLTRLANSIIDGVADAPASVQAEVAKFLGSDLVCYRAGSPDGLVARQTQHWDPIIAWARETLGARFVLGEGVMFVPQPAEALAAAARAIPDEPWRLGAVSAITTLTGSALIALAAGARPFVRRRRLGGRPCRRGLEHAPVGPRRAGARAPGRARGRDAGGGDGAGEARGLVGPVKRRRAVIFLANSGA